MFGGVRNEKGGDGICTHEKLQEKLIVLSLHLVYVFNTCILKQYLQVQCSTSQP